MDYLINENKPSNELQNYFKKQFVEFIKLYNDENDEKFKSEISVFSFKVLKFLCKKYNRNINEQQSTCEFFLYLIEELGIEHFFKIKHKIDIHCKNCRNISTSFDESFHFEMFDQNIDKIDINDFIYSTNILDDYKCDNCKSVSKAIYEKTAINISRYFVIILNKYFSKQNIEYPNEFNLFIKNIDLQNNDKNIVKTSDKPDKCIWNNISQIEHYGNTNSGHYIAMCKRLDNVIKLDDEKISFLEEQDLYSTKNTYMIFYEKK
jgi:ubiquitin C-terminal hydrolase